MAQQDQANNQKFTSTSLPLDFLLGKIANGELGLPELQRPFIWSPKKVRDLFDSMKKGYPIGHLMLWAFKDPGNRTIGSADTSKISQVIIDGQQRLTSLYAVMCGKPVKNDKYEDKDIIISYNPVTDKFEVAGPETKGAEWISDISEYFTANFLKLEKLKPAYFKRLDESREEADKLTDPDKEEILKRIAELLTLKAATLIPVVNINENVEEEDVAEIFVRVNSTGVTLKQHDFILTLYSIYWNDGRKNIEEFCEKERDSNAKNNKLVEVSAQDLIRVIMAYGFNRGRLKYGYKLLRGADFDKKGELDENLRNKQFKILEEKQKDVLNGTTWNEFLDAIMEAGYYSKRIISSKNAIFYSYAMYLIAKHRFDAGYDVNGRLTSLWFFYASLVGLYSGSMESTVEQHLNKIENLKTLAEYREFILERISEDITNDYFDVTLVGSKGLAASGGGNNAWNAYNAALNILDAKVLFSEGSLLLSQLFSKDKGGKKGPLEKHHLFPKSYLAKKGYKDSDINQMANYAFIKWTRNLEILDGDPKEYYPEIVKGMTEDEIRMIEEANALPHGWESMEYEDFLIERRKLMAGKIKEAYEKLRKSVESAF